MARKTEIVTLGSDRYRITTLGAEEGKVIYRQLLSHLANSFDGKLASLTSLTEAQVLSALGPLLFAAVAKLPLEVQERLDKAFAKVTEVPAGEAWLNMAEAQLFDEHFAGRYGALQAWHFAHLKHNFKDFLPSKPKSESSEAGG